MEQGSAHPERCRHAPRTLARLVGLLSLRKRTESAKTLRLAAEVICEKRFQRFDSKPQVHESRERIGLTESKSIPAKREKSAFKEPTICGARASSFEQRAVESPER